MNREIDEEIDQLYYEYEFNDWGDTFLNTSVRVRESQLWMTETDDDERCAPFPRILFPLGDEDTGEGRVGHEDWGHSTVPAWWLNPSNLARVTKWMRTVLRDSRTRNRQRKFLVLGSQSSNKRTCVTFRLTTNVETKAFEIADSLRGHQTVL